MPLLYPELFKQLESVRWNMETDIPWEEFDAARLSDEQAQTIKMNAITEWSALPATEMFLRDNRDDSDFSRVHVDLVLRGAEALAGADGVPAPLPARPRARPRRSCTRCASSSTRRRALETLMLHFCGEIRLNHWYRRAAEWHTEPVIKHDLRARSRRTRRATAAPTCAT